MGLFGWRQLAEWSLEHACLLPAELAEARKHWLAAWSTFVIQLLEKHDMANPETQKALEAIRTGREVAAKPLPALKSGLPGL